MVLENKLYLILTILDFQLCIIVFEKYKCFVNYVPKANSDKFQNIIFSVS